MRPIDAFILGIVQGITEFLPISSSGHLQIVGYLLDIEHQPLLFSLVCHLGTLIAIVITLFHPIKALFKTERQRLLQLILATLPLFPLVLVAKQLKATYGNIELLGYFFMATSLILFLGVRFERDATSEEKERRKWRDALCIGCCQAVALLPGISRSGITISGARVLGWAPQEAVIFSFLLAIPATLGGVVLESYQLLTSSTPPTLSLTSALIGFTTSCAVGLCIFRLLLDLIYKKFAYFAWYCLFLGLAATAYFSL